MTKKYLLNKIEHHLKLSYACYKTHSYKAMLGEYYRARTYYDILCKFYTCKDPFRAFVKEVMGEDAHYYTYLIGTVEVLNNGL